MALFEKILANGPRNHVIHLTNTNAASTATEVVDRSEIFNADGVGGTVAIEKVQYNVWGHDDVTLYWDFSTDENAVSMAGQGEYDWSDVGGLYPKTRSTASGTGDLMLSTATGAAASLLTSGYDITVHCKKG